MWRRFAALAACALAGWPAGCGTTRMTDTARSATEQMLISQAIDRSVNQLDFSALAGRQVFFEDKCLKGVSDEGYLASSLRSKLLADGALLVEDRTKATYVVEARAGCVGTDKHSFLVGVPQMTLPAVMPGQPPAIPEMPLVKSTDQQGVAKIAVFAYNRRTGQAVWQSGVQESASRAKDSWVLGTGPFHRGSVRRTDGPLDQLDVLGLTEGKTGSATASGRPGVTQAAYFPEGPTSGEVQQVSAPTLSPPPGLSPGVLRRLTGPADRSAVAPR
jgi:hypothetical protein